MESDLRGRSEIREIGMRLAMLTPLIMGAVIMVPRVVGAQFGLLDDGLTIAVARQIGSGDLKAIWESGTGRSHPIDWLFNYAVYAMGAGNARWSYLATAALFVGITAGLMWLVRALGGSRLRVWIIGTLFVLGGPVIESFYTLSKPEPQETAWALASLVLLILFYRARSQGGRTAAFVAMCVVFSIGDLTKETSIAMVPIGIAWLMAGLWFWRASDGRPKQVALSAYSGASLVGAAAFLAVRYIFSNPGGAQDTYGSNYVLSLHRIADSLVRWSGFMIRDYAYLVPLVLLWACLSISRRRILDRDWLIGSLAWMGAWFGVYLPWRVAHEYYLLPFSLGAAFLGGVIVEQAVREFAGRGATWRWLIGMGMALAGFLFLTLQLNDLSNARFQLAVDSANGGTLGRLAESLPRDAMLLVNIQASSEYVDEIKMQMPEIYNRADIAVDNFVPGQSYGQSNAGDRFFVMTPVVQNLPLLKARGPGASEANATQWGESMKASLGGSLKPLFEVVRSLRLSGVDLPRLFCPLMRHKGYCITQSPILDLRILRYGWQVYEITR